MKEHKKNNRRHISLFYNIEHFFLNSAFIFLTALYFSKHLKKYSIRFKDEKKRIKIKVFQNTYIYFLIKSYHYFYSSAYKKLTQILKSSSK